MREKRLVVALVASSFVALGSPTQAQEDNREIEIHVGTNDDGSMYFESEEIELEAGESFQITVVNDDFPEGASESNPPPTDKQHDVAFKRVEGESVGGDCPAVSEEEGELVEVCTQERATTTITAPDSPGEGEVEAECEVAGHAQKGMKGEIKITSASTTPTPGAIVVAGLVGVVAVAARRRR